MNLFNQLVANLVVNLLVWGYVEITLKGGDDDEAAVACKIGFYRMLPANTNTIVLSAPVTDMAQFFPSPPLSRLIESKIKPQLQQLTWPLNLPFASVQNGRNHQQSQTETVSRYV